MFVIGGEDNILRGGLFFIAEYRAALNIHRIVDIDFVLGDRVRDTHRCAALGRGMVRQVVLGCRDKLLQLVGGNLRVFANGDRAVFRNIQQAAQTVAGNGSAEMILQCVGLRIRIPISILIVISSGGNEIPRAHMNLVGCDFRAVRHRGLGSSVDFVFHTGAAYADNAAVPFLGRQAGLIRLGSHKISLSRKIPLAAEGAGYVIGRFVIHMGTHIAYQTAASCVGQGLSRIFAIGSNLQTVQFVCSSVFPREGGCQRFRTADDCSRIAHCHAAYSDVIDIPFAVHIGLVVQIEVGILAKGAVRHIDLARGRSFQPDCVRGHRADGDIVPLHVAFDGAAVSIAEHGGELHRFRVESTARHVDIRTHGHDALAPHRADAKNRYGHVACAELRRGIVGSAQMERIGSESAIRPRDFGRSDPLDNIPFIVFFPVLDGGMVNRHIDAAYAYALGMGFQRIGFLRINGYIFSSRNIGSSGDVTRTVLHIV